MFMWSLLDDRARCSHQYAILSYVCLFSRRQTTHSAIEWLGVQKKGAALTWSEAALARVRGPRIGGRPHTYVQLVCATGKVRCGKISHSRSVTLLVRVITGT